MLEAGDIAYVTRKGWQRSSARRMRNATVAEVEVW